jgi:hypothetical protein
MKLFTFSFFVLSFVGCASNIQHTANQGSAATARMQVALNSAQQAEIDLALARGNRLFAQDRRAWIATDLVLPLLDKNKASSYLVLEPSLPSDAAKVIWTQTAAGRSEVFAEVTFAPEADLAACAKAASQGPSCNGIVLKSVVRNLSDAELVMQRAFNTLRKAEAKVCTDMAPNFILLQESDGWIGYVMSARHSYDISILGGHTRVTISADGNKILALQPLYKNCNVINNLEAMPKDATPVAKSATTLVAQLLHEGLVFSALDDALDIYVIGTAGIVVRVKVARDVASAEVGEKLN